MEEIEVRFFAFSLLCITFSNLALGEIKVDLPKNWQKTGKVIYLDNKKIGELISKHEWQYKTDEQFIISFREGFPDDNKFTRFILSGIADNVYCICRRTEYEGANGDAGTWYTRRFWNDGTILTAYSNYSCVDKFEQLLEIAKTIIENDKMN